MTTSHAGFHTQDSWIFEIFFHPISDKDGPRGWYWWPADQNGIPISEENPHGPFDTSEEAYLHATDNGIDIAQAKAS